MAHCLAARDGSALCAPDIQTYLPVSTTTNGQHIAPCLDAHYNDKWGCNQWVNGGGGVITPVGYRWQNDREGLIEDGTAPACRASTGSSGFHEMNHAVVMHQASSYARDNAAHAAVAMVNMQGSKSNAVAQADGPSYTLNAMHGHDVHAVAIGTDCYNGQITGDIAATMGTPGSSVNASGPTVMQAIAVAPTLTAANDPSRSPQSAEVTQQVAAVHAATMAVRRLTPVECERLQGFPDGYTAIPWRGKPATECPDGPRYRALGNSMAVPCMRWIGERIAQVDALP